MANKTNKNTSENNNNDRSYNIHNGSDSNFHQKDKVMKIKQHIVTMVQMPLS